MPIASSTAIAGVGFKVGKKLFGGLFGGGKKKDNCPGCKFAGVGGRYKKRAQLLATAQGLLSSANPQQKIELNKAINAVKIAELTKEKDPFNVENKAQELNQLVNGIMSGRFTGLDKNKINADLIKRGDPNKRNSIVSTQDRLNQNQLNILPVGTSSNIVLFGVIGLGAFVLFRKFF